MPLEDCGLALFPNADLKAACVPALPQEWLLRLPATHPFRSPDLTWQTFLQMTAKLPMPSLTPSRAAQLVDNPTALRAAVRRIWHHNAVVQCMAAPIALHALARVGPRNKEHELQLFGDFTGLNDSISFAAIWLCNVDNPVLVQNYHSLLRDPEFCAESTYFLAAWSACSRAVAEQRPPAPSCVCPGTGELPERHQGLRLGAVQPAPG